MIFDTLCRIAEHSRSEKLTAYDLDGNKTTNNFSNPYFHTILKDTKIFEFSAMKLRDKLKTIDETNDEIDNEFAQEYRESTQHNLPFKNCYFHFYFDPDDDYVDMGILVMPTSMLHILEFYMIYGHDKLFSGCYGRMDNRDKDRYHFEVVNEFHYDKTSDKIIIDDTNKISNATKGIGGDENPNEDYMLKIHGYFSAAMALIYHPKQFILEESPVELKQGKKVARAHQRPKYTVLNPFEIRKILQVHNETGRKVSGHDRRGFDRRYKNPRFVKMQGKKIWIDPVWVGPSEKTIGNKKYKVRLDI